MKKIACVLLAVLLVPLTWLGHHHLQWQRWERAFEKIEVGDSQEKIRQLLGEPDRILSWSQLNAITPTTQPQDMFWDYTQWSPYLSRGVGFRVSAEGKVLDKSLQD